MFGNFWEIFAIFWLTSLGGSLVFSASIDNADLPPETISRLREIKQNIFFSDELTSSEYRDDLDIGLSARENVEDHEWDLLIFTQQWPVTTCYHWREEDKNHECKLPSEKEIWTIHGVWPTKIGQFGPSFCSAGIHPDSNNTVGALHAALVNGLGKNPSIHCLYDSKNDVSYWKKYAYVLINLLKSWTVMALNMGCCFGSYPAALSSQHCHISKPVHYPSLCRIAKGSTKKKWKFPIVNVL
ncbi:hypothetical protein CVS40_12316 [Lucilia cuprina]|nr:hypothetical protein CVS40_12316 [Lucilia cuprina]